MKTKNSGIWNGILDSIKIQMTALYSPWTQFNGPDVRKPNHFDGNLVKFAKQVHSIKNSHTAKKKITGLKPHSFVSNKLLSWVYIYIYIYR